MEIPEIDLKKATGEVLTYLTELIRIDTSNPPGNETAASHYIRTIMEKEGIACRMLGPEPDRKSIIARLNGGKEPVLLLLSHLDVVPAKKEDWRYDPFGGIVSEGKVWGRGSLDCKNITALWMVIMLELKRRGIPLQGDVVMAATADEETGGGKGMGWIARNCPEEVKAAFCLNEGGGSTLKIGGKDYLTLNTAEKSISWLRLTAKGTAGHGSVPIADNAVVHLARAIKRIADTPLPVHITPAVNAFLKAISSKQKFPHSLFIKLTANGRLPEQFLYRGLHSPNLKNSIRAMLRNTVSPTKLEAGYKTNVIPSTASAELDGRILPGQTPEDLVREVKDIIGDDKIDIDILNSAVPSETSLETAMAGIIDRVVQKHRPGTSIAPLLLTGATDGRFLRAMGIPVYGFCPLLPGEKMHLAHGVNEHVSLESLEFSLKILWEVVARYAAGPF